jgi:hypothetical protein
MLSESVNTRFQELISIGQNLVGHIGRDRNASLYYWVPDYMIPDFQRWLSSSVNLFALVSPSSSFYVTESQQLMDQAGKGQGISTSSAQKMLGLLQSAYDEWQKGLLRKIEYIISAATFDDFLDHASMYHKGNKKIEAAVLASAVLEDSVKKVANKQSISISGQSMEQLIDDLTKADVLTSVKAKRLKSHAAVRNHALHAEWDAFDIKDVGELIAGVRELIDNYL